MTKKEMKRIIESDMMDRLNALIYCTEKGYEYCYQCEVSAIKALVWTANSLGLISFEDWKVINNTLHYTEFRM